MHIPDGYLSPQTALVMGTLSLPFLIRAAHEVKKHRGESTLPLVSVFSALSFVIMMFNIPLPGGTTGHAVGATVAAIVLGPWLAILATAMALIIQAVFFGDGGILALGANIFNLAIAMSLTGSFIYRILKVRSGNTRGIHILATAVAGYVAINVSALLTAVELGIQPILFQSQDGRALFFPYPLSVSIPAMMIGHLSVAGIAESIVTALTFSWISRMLPNILENKLNNARVSFQKKLLYGLLFILALATPIGLLAPGTAWGEWGRDELQSLGLGYIPTGFDHWADLWHSPIPDYAISTTLPPAIIYIGSAVLGIMLTSTAITGFGYVVRMMSRKKISIVTFGKIDKWITENSSSLINTLTYILTASPTQHSSGLLQQIDPRTKIIGSIMLLIAVSTTNKLEILFILYVFILVGTMLSKINLFSFIKRTWLILPFFTGIIAFPMLFNIVTPGPSLVTIIPSQLYITLPGVYVASLLLLRVSLSMSISVLILVTTPWNEILKAMGVLGIPSQMIMMFSMTYRYIVVLLTTASQMFIARKSRNVGNSTDNENHLYIGTVIGTLFAKSYAMSSDVYRAMRARGYQGRIILTHEFRFRMIDAVFLTIMVSMSGIAMYSSFL